MSTDTKVSELLKKTIRNTKDSEVKESIENILQSNQQFLNYGKTRVSFCGVFNAGKSALINAIMSSMVVISRPIPSTGVVTRLYYNSEETCSLTRRNGSREEIKFSLDNCLEDITVKDNYNNSDNVKDILQVDIGVPSDFLKGDIELYDTPGLYDDEMMNTITYNHLDHSDFIIFVVDASQLRSLHELLMRYYNRLGRNVIFVANKMDLFEENEKQEIKELAETYFSDYFNPLTFNSDIFYVSAKNRDSQIDKLASFVKNSISENAGRIAAISRMSIIKYLLKQVYEDLKVKSSNELDKRKQRLLNDDKQLLNTLLLELNEKIKNKSIN